MYINAKMFLTQLKNDLIGKDSQRGITITYAWLANQFGHFSLGFIPCVLFYFFFSSWSPVFITLLVCGLWLLFETFNLLGPLMKPSYRKGLVFKPKWNNLIFDTSTDLLFFFFGASVFLILNKTIPVVVIIVIVLSLVALILFIYWYTVKMYIQSAYFPFQFRLSQWMCKISNEDKDKIDKLEKKCCKNQIIIFGGRDTGKTSLAVALATEYSIIKIACQYTTVFKFVESCLNSEQKLIEMYPHLLWTWRKSECLVIDDVNPGNPFQDVVTPEFIRTALEKNESLKNENYSALSNKTVIWVVGETVYKEEWISFVSGFAPMAVMFIS
ncbi:MAG: hypothetical protein IPO21_03820 [Bacteroidales bacterium]|nr:hypothetical protein [Bacteroidales bacterium]